MSSDPRVDFPEYVTGESHREEETLFFPTPENHGDMWMPFCAGILADFAGGALIAISPWLGGALTTIGYSVSALKLRGRRSRFAKALRFSSGITALLGAALATGAISAPVAVQHFVEMTVNRHLIFPFFALMPWVLGVLKYLYAVLWPPKRRTAVKPA